MAVNCPVCATSNPDPSDFCENCGADLKSAAAPGSTVVGDPPGVSQPPPVSPESTAQTDEPVSASDPGSAPRSARLVIKKYGAPSNETIPLEASPLVVGRFDASSGPVEIDLSSFPGAEGISRKHAEVYQEGGRWKVRDLGSLNGVYIRRAGEGGFSPRLQEPAELKDQDEVAFGNVSFVFREA